MEEQQEKIVVGKRGFGFGGKISLLMSLFSVAGIIILCVLFFVIGSNQLVEQSNPDMERIRRELAIFIGIGALIICAVSIGVSIIVGKIVTKPVNQLNAIFSKLTTGDIEFEGFDRKKLENMPQDEFGQMITSFIKMIDNRKALTEAARSMANGDFSVAIIPQSEKDVLAHSMIDIITQLNQLYDTIYTKTVKTLNEGEFDYVGNDDALNGKFQHFSIGFNMTIDALIKHLRIADQVINRIGKGEIPDKINEAYPGDFNHIKDSINACIDGLGALTEGNMVLGHLRRNDLSKIVEGQYCGIYGEIAESINQVHYQLKGVVGIAEHIAEGNLDDLDDLNKFGKQSDEDTLVPSLIGMIEAITLLIKETETMTELAVAGELKHRGNAAQFKGNYAKVIEGFNQTLDAVIAPIEEAAAVLTELSQGNIQTEMTGNYAGDHAEIKEALNKTTAFLKRYVDEITYTLEEIGRGNLNQEITADYQGDFAQIKTAFNGITAHLSATMTEINVAAGQVEVEARQISDSGQALAQGATEQASAIEELNASIEEVAGETKDNAVRANQANAITVTVEERAKVGNNQMGKMITAMGDINASSHDISKIIKVIDDIAFQTNILALNAAVEAARAGQHGKGFAVVAEEVRTLAARSAEAAKQTTGLIEGSIDKVEIGTKIADETAVSLKEILNEIEKITALVSSIAQASNQQASEIAQITSGIEQVSQVVQTNSATAEESAAASEELTGQAELLKQMIGEFQLKNQNKSDSVFHRESKVTANNQTKQQFLEPTIVLDDMDKY